MKVAQLCLTLCDPMDCTVPEILQARILEWVAFPLLQGIFPTQGSNPSLLHCRRILYQLSHKGSPRILEWVAYPFSSGSFWPWNRTEVSCIAGREWGIREALQYQIDKDKASRRQTPEAKVQRYWNLDLTNLAYSLLRNYLHCLLKIWKIMI